VDYTRKIIEDVRSMKLFRRTWRSTLALIVLSSLFIVAWAEHATLLRGAASWWVVSDDLSKPADAIVVLGGGIETRPRAAAELYKRGLGRRIVVVNPQDGEPQIGPTLYDRTFAEMQKLGADTAAIVALRTGVSNTYEEARSVLDWAKTNRAKAVVVPTDLFHTRRVNWIFTKELSSAGVVVKVQAINQPNYSADNWWQHKEGRRAFLTEILKYLFYRVRY
jgi:uncharacterized SAM-binding protein YcdF (DUF218 family)